MVVKPDMEESSRQPAARDQTRGEDRLKALLRLAGRRPAATADMTQRTFAVAHREWLQVVTKRKRRRWSFGLGALAAATVLVAGLGLRLEPSRAEPPLIVATLENQIGVLRRASTLEDESALPPLRVGDGLAIGETLESVDDSRAALRLSNGASLRLGSATRIRIESATLFRLVSGQLYLDSDSSLPSDSVSVDTPLGVIQEIGTQFEVRVLEGDVRVRVREGVAALRQGEAIFETRRGGELSIDEGGSVTRRQLLPYGDEWRWILEIAPSFELEGNQLGSFLEWVSRETGRDVGFDSVQLKVASSGILLHGSVEGLSPQQALESVLPTCGLTFRRVQGRIEIRDA